MNYPNDLKYTKTHEWVRVDGANAEIGLTDYAQHALGDLVYVNLPEAGDALTADKAFADVESVKAVSDVMSPVNGTVDEVNETLLDAPETINEDPYGAWFVRAKDVDGTAELLDAAAYEAFCEEEDAKKAH